MRPKFENRISKRFEHKSTVMLEDERFGYISYGKMRNYSDGGMLIESNIPFKHETQISITLNKPVYNAAPKTIHGTVKWCKKISNFNMCYHYGRYGIGVKYI